MSPVWKAVLGIGAGLVAVNLALGELDDATRGPQGPASSSFATTPRGSAAYAELLERYDHPVLRLRAQLADAELDPDATLVLLDPPGLIAEERAALSNFVAAGGRLIAAGRAIATLGGDLELRQRGPRDAVDQGGALRSVERVRTAGEGVWDGVTQARIVLGTPRAPLLLEEREGSGRAFLLADSSPLQNRLLGEADNAALGVELAGAPPRPVVFVESIHGYEEATGVAAIPKRWWWVLGGLALAALLFALASGRRLGPPERERRELAPPRAEFADAVATALAKSRPRREAVATARRIVRERLTRAARLPVDAGDDAVRRAAGELRLDDSEVEIVLGQAEDDRALLALGRLLVDIERKEARA